MPRRLLGVLLLLLGPAMHMHAQGDAVLMKVGAEEVGLKEFEYFYRRSLAEKPEHFLQTFIDYKLKLQYAKELSLDTVQAYCLQKAFLCEAGLAKQEKRTQVERNREWVKLSHVTIPLKQHAHKREEAEAKAKIDSLYTVLARGDGWGKASKEMPWMQTRFLLKEWQEQLKVLPQGQISKPFYSPQGVHLIAWTDKRNVVVEAQAPVRPEDEKYRKQEIADGLLIAMLAVKEQENLVYSEQELESFWREHRKEYGWGVPHFKGMVIHCKDKKEAKAIRKYLSKYPMALWEEALRRRAEKTGASCKYVSGCYRIGENAYVDKLAFKCGSFVALSDFPYTWILGDKLKKGPESYADVKEKVEKGYRELMKSTAINRLRQKYSVEINEEVLKTVNNEGNN